MHVRRSGLARDSNAAGHCHVTALLWSATKRAAAERHPSPHRDRMHINSTSTFPARPTLPSSPVATAREQVDTV